MVKRARDGDATSQQAPEAKLVKTSGFADMLVGPKKRPLLAQTLRFLDARGFKNPSPVQDVCIPAFLDNKDVAVEACTGSGKTLAFLIPVIERLYLRLQAVQTGTDSIETPAGGFDGLSVSAVVMAPTRELINQIGEVWQGLLKSYKADAEAAEIAQYMFGVEIFGGRPMKNDLTVVTKLRERLPPKSAASSLQPYGLLLATPGRLQSHFDGVKAHCLKLDYHWTFRGLEVLVLDEADRLFADSNFQAQMHSCLSKLPKQRRTGVFSATLTDELRNLSRAGMRAPLFIKLTVESQTLPAIKKERKTDSDVPTTGCDSDEMSERKSDEKSDEKSADKKDLQCEGSDDTESSEGVSMSAHSVPASLVNSYVSLESTERLCFLLKLLRHTRARKVMLFCSTCCYVNWLSAVVDEVLRPAGLAQGWEVLRLHGNMAKGKRASTVRGFRKSQQRQLLLSSDLGARGLDFEQVDLVVQMDPPASAPDYFHRIGRTARAGQEGESLLFLDPAAEDTYVRFLATKGAVVAPFKQEEEVKQLSLGASSRPSFPELLEKANLSVSADVQQEISECVVRPTNKGSPSGGAEDALGSEGEDGLGSESANIFESDCRIVLGLVKAGNIRDRKLLEIAKTVFVSKIRELKENTLQFIFIFEKAELGLLASSLGLLRIPRVTELPNTSLVKHFKRSAHDPESVTFLDAAVQQKFEARVAERRQRKEDERLARLEKIAEAKKRRLGVPRSKADKIAQAWEDFYELAEDVRADRREAKQFAESSPKSCR